MWNSRRGHRRHPAVSKTLKRPAFLECGAVPPLSFSSFFRGGPGANPQEKKKRKRRKSAALQNTRLACRRRDPATARCLGSRRRRRATPPQPPHEPDKDV